MFIFSKMIIVIKDWYNLINMDGIYRYCQGEFETYEEAKECVQKLIEKIKAKKRYLEQEKKVKFKQEIYEI